MAGRGGLLPASGPGRSQLVRPPYPGACLHKHGQAVRAVETARLRLPCTGGTSLEGVLRFGNDLVLARTRLQGLQEEGCDRSVAACEGLPELPRTPSPGETSSQGPAPTAGQCWQKKRQTFRVQLAYYGPDFTGWTWAPGLAGTTQGCVQDTLSELCGNQVRLWLRQTMSVLAGIGCTPQFHWLGKPISRSYCKFLLGQMALHDSAGPSMSPAHC